MPNCVVSCAGCCCCTRGERTKCTAKLSIVLGSLGLGCILLSLVVNDRSKIHEGYGQLLTVPAAIGAGLAALASIVTGTTLLRCPPRLQVVQEPAVVGIAVSAQGGEIPVATVQAVAVQADWLSGWLAELDGGAGTFVRHAPAFRARGFDSVPALAALTDADLVAMGVPVGHRRVILAHVQGGGGGGGGGKVVMA